MLGLKSPALVVGRTGYRLREFDEPCISLRIRPLDRRRRRGIDHVVVESPYRFRDESAAVGKLQHVIGGDLCRFILAGPVFGFDQVKAIFVLLFFGITERDDRPMGELVAALIQVTDQAEQTSGIAIVRPKQEGVVLVLERLGQERFQHSVARLRAEAVENVSR